MKYKLFLLFNFIIVFTSEITAQNNIDYELINISFEGNNAIASDVLLSSISSKESPSWISKFLYSFTSFGSPPIYFDSSRIKTDLDILKNIYRANGYFKVKLNANYVLDDESKVAELFFTVEENHPAKFEEFIFFGLDKLPPEYQSHINSLIDGIDTNTFYSESVVSELRNNILNHLLDNGYMLASMDSPEIIVDTSYTKVKVSNKFFPRRWYKISELRVEKTGEGEESVENDLIRSLVRIKPEDRYSSYEIKRGQSRLYRTEMFSSVFINRIIEDTLDNTVPLGITTDIGPMNEIAPEIIMNNQDNFFNLGLGTNFLRKNFLGDARKLNIGGSVAIQDFFNFRFSNFINNLSLNDTTLLGYADARIGIEQPYLLGSPVISKLEAYLTLQKRKKEYNSTLLGTKLSLDFELPQYTFLNSLTLYYNIEGAELVYRREYVLQAFSAFFFRVGATQSEVDALINGLSQSLPEKLALNTTNGVFGALLSSNKTNDLMFPTKGYSLSLLIEEGNAISFLTGLVGRDDPNYPLYYKVVGTATAFPDIYESSTSALGLKLKLGNIHAYRGRKYNIPLNQQLYAGGSNSIRGWRFGKLVPPLSNEAFTGILDNPTSENLDAFLFRGIDPGGFFLFETSIEQRNRLLGNFGSALFIDAGNTWDSYNSFRFDQVAVAAGFGFRYYSQFAPFRFDFGFKIFDPSNLKSIFKKSLFSEVFEFHFGIGEAF